MITRIQKLVGARMVAMLLLAFWCAWVLAPLSAAAEEPQPQLPICCRAHGDHHCKGLKPQGDSNQTTLVAHCPYAPLTTSTSPNDCASFIHASTCASSPTFSSLAPTQASQRPRFKKASANSQRGPPATALS